MKRNVEALLAPGTLLSAAGIAALLLLFTLSGWILHAPKPPASGQIVALQTVLPAPSSTPVPSPAPGCAPKAVNP